MTAKPDRRTTLRRRGRLTRRELLAGAAGAIGAAMETLRVVRRKGETSFIGLDATINLAYTTINDESTVCHFCPNECSRTFIDTTTPDALLPATTPSGNPTPITTSR